MESMVHIEAKPEWCVSNIQPDDKLWRLDHGGERHYYTVDFESESFSFYPSWTTVISGGLGMGWPLVEFYAKHGIAEARNIRDKQAAYGTLLHILCATILQNGELDSRSISSIAEDYCKENDYPAAWAAEWLYMLKSDVLAFAQWVIDKEVTSLAVEFPCVSRVHGVAGTIDIVCELTFNRKRVVAIVDIKSGRKGFFESHAVQLAGYQAMWNESDERPRAEMVFNWSPKDWEKSPTYNFVNQTDSPSRELLLPAIAAYMARNPNPAPRPIKRIDGIISIASGTDITALYSYVDAVEYLTSRHFKGELV